MEGCKTADTGGITGTKRGAGDWTAATGGEKEEGVKEGAEGLKEGAEGLKVKEAALALSLEEGGAGAADSISSSQESGSAIARNPNCCCTDTPKKK